MRSDVREIKLISRPKGIGDVILKGKPVARVRYRMRYRRMVEGLRTGDGHVEEIPIQALVDGNIQILEGETSLYSDRRYTLHLEDEHQRERVCDFYCEPMDVVKGMYHLEGCGDFRELPRRRRPA